MADQPLNVGDVAPDFTLKDQTGNSVTLSSLRGKKVVLSWHPFAWTGVCAVQMKNLDKHRGEFESRGAVALGMSVDTVPSKKAWAEDLGNEDGARVPSFFVCQVLKTRTFGTRADRLPHCRRRQVPRTPARGA